MKKTKHIKIVKPATTTKPGKPSDQDMRPGDGGGGGCIPIR